MAPKGPRRLAAIRGNFGPYLCGSPDARRQGRQGAISPLVMAGRQFFVGDELVLVTPKGSNAYSEAAVCEAIGG
jgi:hypothetical protein